MPAREMGGDLYAYHAFDGNRFAVTVGDVSGKGMPAALLMAVSVASFRAVVGQGLTPSDLLAHLDQTIAPYTATTGQNCALVYVEIRLEAGRQRLCVANAGCMAPLVRRTDHSVLWSEAYGTPLGTRLSSEFGYQEFKLSLSPGDLVILTSDGVVEAINSRHEMFGFERLEQAVTTGPTASAAAMLDHLRSQVDAFIDGAEPNDDLTIVVVQV
jgi:serine phosphatase RsbU (regulator of sigma subunit)